MEVFIPLLFTKKNCGGILRLEVFIPLTIPFFLGGGDIIRLEIFSLTVPKKIVEINCDSWRFLFPCCSQKKLGS